jgi:cytochrome c oxidase cbb3-type subunit 4
MDIILFHSIWTVLLLVLFIGIWAWAWSNKRKGAFDAAARLPLEDDDVQGCTSVAGGTTPWMEEVGPRREQRPRTPRVTDDLNLPTHRGDKNHG